MAQRNRRSSTPVVAGAALVAGALGWSILPSPARWIWVGLVIVGTTANIVMVRRASGSAIRRTGRSVMVDDRRQQSRTSWIGGANVPGALGRVNATWPLAVLEVDRSEARLRIRPRLLARFFGVAEFTVPAINGRAFPARGWFRTAGIGIEASGREPLYFWYRNREPVLAILQAAGFAVSGDEEHLRF